MIFFLFLCVYHVPIFFYLKCLELCIYILKTRRNENAKYPNIFIGGLFHPPPHPISLTFTKKKIFKNVTIENDSYI